jgi:hypothetical protein
VTFNDASIRFGTLSRNLDRVCREFTLYVGSPDPSPNLAPDSRVGFGLVFAAAGSGFLALGCWAQMWDANSFSRSRSKFRFISSMESPRGGPKGLNAHAHSEQAQPWVFADLAQIISLMTAPSTAYFLLSQKFSRGSALQPPAPARAISPAFPLAPQPAAELPRLSQWKPARNAFSRFAS